MSSSSQKHRCFVNEPMGKKRVIHLAGIGEVLGQRLENKGITKANMVYGQFLAMDQDRGKFQSWMNSACQANRKQADDCYNCLREWSNEFL